MIALFNEPIEIEVLSSVMSGGEVLRQGLLLGVIHDAADDLGLTVNESGILSYVDLEQCRTKWRYDKDLEDWMDTGEPEVTEPT